HMDEVTRIADQLLLLDGGQMVGVGPLNELLARLHQQLDIPIIYVSHHMDEVTRIADQLLLLDGGQVVGVGPLNEVLARLDLPLATAADASVVLEGRLVRYDHELAEIESIAGHLWVPTAHLPTAAESMGSCLRLRIHARDISISRQRPVASSILNVLEATVEACVDAEGRNDGAVTVVRLNAGGAPLLARVTRRSVHELGLIVAGTSVYAQIKGVAIE
ncbi:MAG: molybdenum ABC transporter ATP-binding protein, partial [Gammaproteobacteria bacterium]|nr:molybdenum ABC transporter ATP-binding protein [Gammaproteobacteria bacterium]